MALQSFRVDIIRLRDNSELQPIYLSYVHSRGLSNAKPFEK